MDNPITSKIGSGKPNVAIVGCLHGDEIIGKRVAKALEDITLLKGSITFIIANPQALKKNKRFIKKDLNRSFPGKKGGVIEERIAHKLIPVLKKFDLVLDIHATNSDFKDLVIIVKKDKAIQKALKQTPISKVALIKSTTFGGHEMINFCKVGLSLEYGPDKTGENSTLAIRHIESILRNMGMIKGSKKLFRRKELYIVTGTYPLEKFAQPNKNLKNFKQIKVGQPIATLKNNKILSNKNFYPLFLGKGRYKKTLALTSTRSEWFLK